jgi:Flp pilus assembly pilin Flp
MERIKRFFRDEEGMGLAEEALLLLLIAVVSVAILTTIGGTISGIFNTANTDLGAT